MFSDVDIISCDFFLKGELSLHFENGFFNICLVLNSLSMTTPRTFLESMRFFFFTAPRSSWILNVQQQSSAWCYYRKWPQGSSTVPCPTLVLQANWAFGKVGFQGCELEYSMPQDLVSHYFFPLSLHPSFSAQGAYSTLFNNLYGKKLKKGQICCVYMP